jgi:hypothetical protein
MEMEMEIPPLGEATVLVLLRGTGKQTERRGKKPRVPREDNQNGGRARSSSSSLVSWLSLSS